MQRTKQVHNEGPELNIIRELFQEYEKELNTDLSFQNFEEEVKNPLKKYGAPKGTLILAYWDDKPAGCIALTPMNETGYCEMKRLYLRPTHRNFGIGRELVKELINIAITNGYKKMRLDTFKKLQPAIRLYESFDFYYIDPYYNNPFPDVVFMEKKLA